MGILGLLRRNMDRPDFDIPTRGNSTSWIRVYRISGQPEPDHSRSDGGLSSHFLEQPQLRELPIQRRNIRGSCGIRGLWRRGSRQARISTWFISAFDIRCPGRRRRSEARSELIKSEVVRSNPNCQRSGANNGSESRSRKRRPSGPTSGLTL